MALQCAKKNLALADFGAAELVDLQPGCGRNLGDGSYQRSCQSRDVARQSVSPRCRPLTGQRGHAQRQGGLTDRPNVVVVRRKRERGGEDN